MSFDVTLAKSKEYYNLLIQRKAVLPKGAKRLQDKFNLDSELLSKIYLLLRNVCVETYLRDFQFKVLNYITCTNVLLKNNNNNNKNIFMQDDHFSYQNCYQHGSCVKKTNKTKLDLKKLYKNSRNYPYEKR